MKNVKYLILSLAFFLATIGASSQAPLTAPVKPGASSPTNGGLTTSLSPVITWTNTAGIGGTYDIEVATDPATNLLTGAFTGAYNVDSATGFSGNTHTVAGPLVPAKTYYWHVQAYDSLSNASGWSTTFTFRTAVPPPTLSDPADMSTLPNNRPTFKWSSVLNASGYNLRVSTVSTFSSMLLNVTVPYTTTKYTATTDLPSNTTLYWQVRTLNNVYGPGAWSSYFTISQTAIPPTTPLLLQPANNKLTDDYTPRLVWQPVTIPSSTSFSYYEVQISTSSAVTYDTTVDSGRFSTTFLDDTSVTSQVVDTSNNTSYFDVPDPANQMDPATTYYWHVRAVNSDGSYTYYSNWSNIFALRTTVPQVTPLIQPGVVVPNMPPLITDYPPAVVLTDNRPIFDWTTISPVGQYNLQISKSPTFASVLANINVLHPPYQPAVALPANVVLFWRVRGLHSTYGPGRWSEVWWFQTANPPTVPVLKLPAKYSLQTDLTPTFTWSISNQPPPDSFAYYEIQITKDATFTTTAIDDTGLTNPSFPQFSPGGLLDPVSTYYWRVRACNGAGGCSQWSSVFFFKTAVAPPTLVTYGGGSLSLPFDWNDVPFAASYMIQISKSSNFGTLVRNVTVYSSDYTTSLPNGNYWWRVRTNYGNTNFGPSAWSTDSFVVP